MKPSRRSLAPGRSAMARTQLAGLAFLGMTALPAVLVAAGGAVEMNGAACTNCNGVGNQGGGFQQWWHRCGVDWHRNNAWPEPFLSADKMAVRAPYCIQIDNGWKMQNTIGSFLFDRESQRINKDGDLLVKWIISQGHANSRY